MSDLALLDPTDRAELPADISPKRRQMLAAAEALFLAHGYGLVSMDAIARAAGVSKATLYAHFVSKDRLFATIVADKGAESPLDEDNFPAVVTDLRAALRNIGQRAMRFMLRERTLAIYRVVMAESARFPELGLAFYESGPHRMAQRFTAWVIELERAGLIHAPKPEMATQQFMGLIRSCLFLRATLVLPPAPTDAEIDETVDAAVDTWLKAYGTSASA